MAHSGFVSYYLQFSQNAETMSTTADYNVTMQLAQIDKQRDNKSLNLTIQGCWANSYGFSGKTFNLCFLIFSTFFMDFQRVN